MKISSKTLLIGDSNLTLETGVLAQQATSSVLAKLGDTMVLSTVVMGRNDTELGYFPLSVEYVERLYAGGRIKGSKWVKREGRPSDDAILKARLIDRSIRPLFPKELKKDVQVVVTVLSVDGENDPGVLGIIATSAALAVSKIPWKGPISGINIGLVRDNGQIEFVVNPGTNEEEFTDLEVVVSGTKDKAIMIEAEGKQIAEEEVVAAIEEAKVWNGKIVDFINELVAEVGESKIELSRDEKLDEAIVLVEKSHKDKILKLMEGGIGEGIGSEIDALGEEVYKVESENFEDKRKIKDAVDYVFKKSVRERILNEGKRPDGRPTDEVRPISVKVGILPRTHGSAIFQRGDTQVLTVATLAMPSYEQLIESPEGEEAKRYMHHYSMPPYSVGETGRVGSPSRREIGHGALAEKAIEAVMPLASSFPYAVRVVSEVMSSNGSTSMASTCGSTLALMDAGVPIVSPVAGIAMGMMSDDKKYVIMTDIIGLEDFSGDMDFKVAGTKNGVTAIQLDVKNSGLNREQIEETLAKAKVARLSILEKMLSIIPESRTGVSKFAPKIKVIKINPEKIGEVIGSGGKVIKNIIASTGAQIDVEEDGSVTIASIDEEAVEKAVSWVELLTRELQRGEVFEGKVKRILPFGAFVEIVPGKEGMVHVSEMSENYVNNPNDVIKLDQIVKVRVKEIDDQGRVNLSMLFGERQERPQRVRDERIDRERRREDFVRRPAGRNASRNNRDFPPRRDRRVR